MNRLLKTILILSVAWLIPLGAAFAKETPDTPEQPLMSKTVTQALRNGHVLLNFENIDIRVLARMMAELTGRNIVVDSAVKGKVTILSSREVTIAEAWDIFKAAAVRYGFAVQVRGDHAQIVPITVARSTGDIVRPTANTLTGDDMVMAILILKRGDPEQIEKTVKPLLSENGLLAPYKDGRAVLVVDRAQVVSRVSQIVKGLDTLQPDMLTSVVFPKYMEADKVVTAIKPLYQDKISKYTFAITAFAPSNGVVISGSLQDITDVKRILQRLDIPMAAPTKTEPARFFVYNLQFAQAEDVAKILSEMLSERQKAVEQQLKEAKVPATEGAAAAGSNTSDTAKSDSSEFRGATDGITGPTGSGADTARVGFTSSKVSADSETNSLVLYVSPSEYDDLKTVIAKLDAERRQIQISAVVAEVSLKRIREVGVNWQTLTSGGIIGSYKGGLTEEGLLNVLAGGNFVIGASSGNTRTITVSNQSVEVPETFAFISALNSNSDFNLISAPRVLTQDNKQATINVGQVVPFATGAKLDSYGQPMVTFDYREVGIKLEVTPHLSRTGKIRMDVSQQIQEVTDYLNQEMAGVKFSAPVVSNRTVKTTVTIPDGRTLLIGGLIAKSTSDAVKGVPILSKLPLIGFLFRDKETNESKSSIFISLTPKIVSLDERVDDHDAPLTPFMQHQGLPGDQQYENRDTVDPAAAEDPQNELEVNGSSVTTKVVKPGTGDVSSSSGKQTKQNKQKRNMLPAKSTKVGIEKDVPHITLGSQASNDAAPEPHLIRAASTH